VFLTQDSVSFGGFLQ